MILVVDDDVLIAKTLRRKLQKEGYDVALASDGVEAYETVSSQDCHCMLLDVNMPRVNGVELLFLMAADGIEVPTIVMAGFQDFDLAEMLQLPNVVNYFNKPFPLGDVVGAVHKQLAAHG